MLDWFTKIFGRLKWAYLRGYKEERRKQDEVSRLRTDHTARANVLANRVGVTIHDSTHVPLWSLPILEELVKRIETLERRKIK